MTLLFLHAADYYTREKLQQNFTFAIKRTCPRTVWKWRIDYYSDGQDSMIIPHVHVCLLIVLYYVLHIVILFAILFVSLLYHFTGIMSYYITVNYVSIHT